MEQQPTLINGKHYPMWSQFVEKKAQWIGGKLIDHDMGLDEETEITDIVLRENGETSAWFDIVGKDFSWGGDVEFIGIGSPRLPEATTIYGYAGTSCSIICPLEKTWK